MSGKGRLRSARRDGESGPERFPEAARIGVVSDTHGLLRPELFDRFADVDLILHAGDVVHMEHLLDLGVLAPVRAVYGNVDGPELRRRLPRELELEVGGVRIVMAHGHRGLDAEALLERFPRAAVVIQGHTHLPRHERSGDVLLLNPGSAGPRRSGKPVSAARISVRDGEAEARHVMLDEASGGQL